MRMGDNFTPCQGGGKSSFLLLGMVKKGRERPREVPANRQIVAYCSPHVIHTDTLHARTHAIDPCRRSYDVCSRDKIAMCYTSWDSYETQPLVLTVCFFLSFFLLGSA